MAGKVMSHHTMCGIEGLSLQRGMNFKVRGGHSVILMSQRPGSPYRDALSADGVVLSYEGHDAPRNVRGGLDPKTVDQPMLTPGGRLTQNGLFFQAAQAAARGAPPERVRVYEKIRDGIWSYAGLFVLRDVEVQHDGQRHVFVFKLHAVEEADETDGVSELPIPPRLRTIPSYVKVEVWKRDGGACVQCGATEDLHFDHILPYTRGGTSITAQNVQLLCARHNLAKSDRVQ